MFCTLRKIVEKLKSLSYLNKKSQIDVLRLWCGSSNLSVLLVADIHTLENKFNNEHVANFIVNHCHRSK